MDRDELTHRNGVGQGAPRVYQRRDGSWVVAYGEGGVTKMGRLTIVPAAIDRFEDALSNARKMLQNGAAAGVADDAFALFDYRVGAALKVLRQALKP